MSRLFLFPAALLVLAFVAISCVPRPVAGDDLWLWRDATGTVQVWYGPDVWPADVVSLNVIGVNLAVLDAGPATCEAGTTSVTCRVSGPKPAELAFTGTDVSVVAAWPCAFGSCVQPGMAGEPP